MEVVQAADIVTPVQVMDVAKKKSMISMRIVSSIGGINRIMAIKHSL